MFSRIVYILIVMNIIDVFAGPHRSTNLLSKRTKFCGTQLRSALSRICEGDFYGRSRNMKRSDMVDFDNKMEDDSEYMDVDFNKYPFIPRDLAEALIPIKGRRGVVDECCDKSCSLDELRTYCAA